MFKNITLILIYGYAKSGKTTLLRELRLKNYQVVSTSVELDYVVCEYYNLPRYFVEVLPRKKDHILQEYSGDDEITCRELKMLLADEIIIPKYGRGFLAKRALANQYNSFIKHKLLFFETVGGEEALITKDIWLKYYGNKVVDINIRRNSEKPGIDLRELSSGLDFNNNYDSPELAATNFLEKVKMLLELN